MSRHVTSMTIYDVDHYSKAERDAIVSSYPAHEREARSKGVPTMGSGRIFPIAEEEITIDPMPVPKHWYQIIGVDFGYDHPFAAVHVVWDRDWDSVYVCKAYRQRQATPVIHAAAVRPWGAWVPCAWPHDGLQHDKGSGYKLAQLYKDQKLNMLGEHTTHEDGGNGVEAGLMDMLDRMQTGRFHVFSNLSEWFEEFRLYHRKKLPDNTSKIVKEREDLMSATRYAVMMLRFAKQPPRLGVEKRRPRLGTIA